MLEQLFSRKNLFPLIGRRIKGLGNDIRALIKDLFCVLLIEPTSQLTSNGLQIRNECTPKRSENRSVPYLYCIQHCHAGRVVSNRATFTLEKFIKPSNHHVSKHFCGIGSR